MSGAEWMLGPVGKKKPTPVRKVSPGVTPAQLDEVERFLDDPAEAGKQLVGGLNEVIEGVKKLQTCGLTFDALVLLIQAKCPRDTKGNETSLQQVERVLQGLARLPEHLR